MAKNRKNQVAGFAAADIAAIEERLQQYKELAMQIEAAVPHNLTEEADEKAIHAALVKSSENLYQMNVKLRNAIGDLTKKFIGTDGSIADQAVKRRNDLFAKKKDTKAAEAKKPEEAETAK